MLRKTHWFAVALCVVQCTSLLLHNVFALWPSLPAVGASQIGQLLRVHGQYTRGHTSHGFFAPQVASMFILQLSREVDRDTVRWSGPELHTVGGKTRYIAFLNWLQYLLPDSTNAHTAQRDHVQAIVYRIARTEMPPLSGMPARITVYAVKPVPLGTPNGTGRPELRIVHDETLSINYTSHD